MSDTDETSIKEGEDNALYNMSDAEIEAMDPEEYAAGYAAKASVEPEDEPVEEEVTEPEALEAEEEELSDDESEESELDVSEAPGKQEEEATETEEEESDVEEIKQEPEVADPSIELNKIMAPFKANGGQMQVNTADEAIALMQQGANYTSKMQAIKPHLETLKLLELNGIKGTESINYLIDLYKKDPKAINKLVKESGLDPLDMDVEGSNDYQPTQHSTAGVSDAVDLDQVLDNIQRTPTYDRTINVIGKQWDESSRTFLGKNPAVIEVINDHMQNGVYDITAAELTKQQTLGRMKGLTDLEAYRQVADNLNAQGSFNHLFTPQEQEQEVQNQPAIKRLAPKQKVEDPKLKAKRKAAGAAKQTASTGSKADFNPLGMSDAEFDKQFAEQLAGLA